MAQKITKPRGSTWKYTKARKTGANDSKIIELIRKMPLARATVDLATRTLPCIMKRRIIGITGINSTIRWLHVDIHPVDGRVDGGPSQKGMAKHLREIRVGVVIRQE